MIEKLALAGTIAAGIAIGLLWPISKQSADRGSATELVLQRQSDHHYYIDAKVNGRLVHFMIDTGAGETALTEADAQRIGLQFDPQKYEVLGDGASGMVRGQYVHVESVEVAGIRQTDARVVIVPGATVSLLGQPFLERIDEINIRHGEMRLKFTS